MKKLLSVFLAALLLFSFAAIPVYADGEDVTISYYAYMNEDDQGILIPKQWSIDQMKEVMPNVEVEVIPWYAQDDTIKIWAASNELPDIIEVNQNATIAELVDAGKLMPLEKYLEAYNWPEEIKASYYEGLKSEDGHIYQIPTLGADTVMLYYNKALFEKYDLEPPTDIDKVKKAIEVFAANDILPIGLWGDEIWPAISLFDGIITRYNPEGIKVFNGYVDLSAESYYIEAVQTLLDLQEMGAFTPDLFTTGYNDAFAKFAAGETAMFQNGTWCIGDVYAALGDDAGIVNSPWGDAATMEASKGNMSAGTNLSAYICAAANSEHPDVVGEYMAQLALLNLEGNVLKSSKMEGVLTKEIVPENPYTPLQEEYAAIMSEAENFSCISFHLLNLDVVDTLTIEFQELLSGNSDPETLIKNVQKTIDKEFK